MHDMRQVAIWRAAMAKMTPIVQGGTLVYQQQGHDQVLVVGTPDWYTWLATASAFAFIGAEGTFTARKERAGNKRGGWSWNAYRTQRGKLSSIYLGKSETLSLERLNAVAQALAQVPNKDAIGENNTNKASLPEKRIEPPFAIPASDLPLLTTKLYVPRPHAPLVDRPHLIERLKPAAEHPLTLVAAPAGFGKTTLLSAWLEHAAL